jgi:hypothetical protein
VCRRVCDGPVKAMSVAVVRGSVLVRKSAALPGPRQGRASAREYDELGPGAMLGGAMMASESGAREAKIEPSGDHSQRGASGTDTTFLET